MTRSLHASTSRKALIIGAVASVALLGNLRQSTSEAIAAPARTSGSIAFEATTERASASSDASPGGEGAEADGALQLVPAIYARDPEMRYVYYRNVSKWM